MRDYSRASRSVIPYLASAISWMNDAHARDRGNTRQVALARHLCVHDAMPQITC